MSNDNIYGLNFNIAVPITPSKQKEESKPAENSAQKKRGTETEPPQTEKPKPPPPKEVRFISADEWVAGDTGFEFNKKCTLRGKVEFLIPNTVKRKIEGETVVVTDDNVKENLRAPVVGYIDDNGEFKLDVTLYFGNHFYGLLEKEPKTKCKYYVENIKHFGGVNSISSAPLEMPSEPMKLDVEFSL